MTFFVAGIPVPKGSMRAFTPRGWNRPVLTSTGGAPLKSWEHSVRVCAMSARPAGWLMAQAMAVELVFFIPRPKSVSPQKRPRPTAKPDIDKIARAVLDALTGTLYNDDAQVVALYVEKWYAAESGTPGVEVQVNLANA